MYSTSYSIGYVLNSKQKGHSNLNKSNSQTLTFAFLHIDIREEAGHVIKIVEKLKGAQKLDPDSDSASDPASDPDFICSFN